MKKLMILLFSSLLLTSCGKSKEEQIAYYLDSKNADEYIAKSNKCIFNARDAKDCDILAEVTKRKNDAMQKAFGFKQDRYQKMSK